MSSNSPKRSIFNVDDRLSNTEQRPPGARTHDVNLTDNEKIFDLQDAQRSNQIIHDIIPLAFLKSMIDSAHNEH